MNLKRTAVLAACCALLAAAHARAQDAAAAPERAPAIGLPGWLFPIDPNSLLPPPKTPPELDDTELLSIPDSDQKFTQKRIADAFNPPDWHPADHIAMPEVVAQGRKPAVLACGYCHTPTGQGRPENAALAGLPAAYIKEQLQAYRDGERQFAGPDAFLPGKNMQAVAAAMTDEEIDASASYFSQQKLARRHFVAGGINIPRAEPAAWVYEEVAGSEDLGDRLLEVAPDITRHERRDDRMQYTVYVPPGAVALGKLLATTGGKGKTQVCASCHLARLQGTDRIPPISGRSPTYLLRQLIAFRNGLRNNEAARQMDAVVARLELEDMVALAAYVGSLYPQ